MNWTSRISGTVKGGLKRGLGRFGFFLGRYPNTYTLESHLAHLFQKLRINVVLDVGAHHGEFGEELRLLGYQGEIVSFEPVSENFAILQRRCREDSRWRAFPYALAAEEKTAELNVFSGSTFTSFLQPSEFGKEQFAAKLNVQRKVAVEVKRLDRIFAACLQGVSNPRVFLKMDTQGFDLEVIQGATGCLSAISGVQTELSVLPIYEKMADGFSVVLPELNRHGFQVTGMYPVTRHPADQLRVAEFDCVLCRRPEPPVNSLPASQAAVGAAR